MNTPINKIRTIFDFYINNERLLSTNKTIKMGKPNEN